MVLGILSILIGILIFANLIFNISFTLSILIESILAIIFIFDGLKIFRKMKSENLGNLFFGVILIFDLFKFFNFNASFGELVLLFIASQLLANGIIELFFRGKSFNFSKNKLIQNEKNFELKNTASLKVNTNIDWNKCNITSTSENSIKINSIYNKSIFNQKLEFENNHLIFEEKLRINSINIPERAENIIYIPEHIDSSFDISANVSDITLDFYNMNSNYIKLNSKASKIHLIPSAKHDSIIDINIQVSNLTLEIPSNVFVVINYIGDLTLKELTNFTQKDDSTLVSNNFEKSQYTCKVNISSEMSKISSFNS